MLHFQCFSLHKTVNLDTNFLQSGFNFSRVESSLSMKRDDLEMTPTCEVHLELIPSAPTQFPAWSCRSRKNLRQQKNHRKQSSEASGTH